MANCECCDGGCGKDIRVSFCPKCESRSVRYVFGFGNIFGVIPKMKCRDCGFESPTFPILIANQEELKKAIGEMKKKIKKTKEKVVKKKVVKKVARRNKK
jgi:hypothetical protein